MENDYQQQDEYRRRLADPEAQAEYERFLDGLDKETASKVRKSLSEFDWFGEDDEQDSSGLR